MREFLLQEIGRKDSQRAPMLPEIERKDLQRELLLQEDNVANFQYVFFTNSVIKDENLRKRLLQELHEEVYNNGKLSLDTSLLLNFPSEEGVDLKKLVKDLDSINWIASNSDKWLALSNAIESSKVLKNEGNEHIFKCMLKEAVKTERSDILQKLYQYYFPKKSGSELDLYLVDIVRKWQLFLAISMTQILLAKYVMGMNPVLGKVLGVIGIAFTGFGRFARLDFCGTKGFGIICVGNGEVIRWMIIFVILSVISLASAIILSGVWINMIQGAVIVLLLTGRLCYGSIKIT